MSKLPKKFKTFGRYGDLRERFKDVVYNSVTVVDTECNWEGMLDEFELQDNECLNGMFKLKEMWVPVSLRDTFLAGM